MARRWTGCVSCSATASSAMSASATTPSIDGSGLKVALGSPVVSNQVEYSLAQRSPDQDLVPFAAASDRLIIAYSPLAQGFLAAKYDADHRPGGVRLANPLFLDENLDPWSRAVEHAALGGQDTRCDTGPGRPGMGHPPSQRRGHPRRLVGRPARAQRRSSRPRAHRRRRRRAHRRIRPIQTADRSRCRAGHVPFPAAHSPPPRVTIQPRTAVADSRVGLVSTVRSDAGVDSDLVRRTERLGAEYPICAGSNTRRRDRERRLDGASRGARRRRLADASVPTGRSAPVTRHRWSLLGRLPDRAERALDVPLLTHPSDGTTTCNVR